MSHPQQRAFTEEVKRRFPQFFTEKDVLDCGSLDMNGNNRFLFNGGKYVGVDAFAGKNVDIVCRVHELGEDIGRFDVVISTEMLEHDEFWQKSLKKMIDVLRCGGLLIVTCATTGRGEHLTNRTEHIPGYDWRNYYRNIAEKDWWDVINVGEVFGEFEFKVVGTDLYFWGIKK